MRVLTVNAGSSSLKLSLVDTEQPQARVERQIPAPDAELDSGRLAAALSETFSDIDAVGHRIVHGGPRFDGPVLIDQATERELTRLTDLAPLHQPKSLAALRAVTELRPHIPAVACFDTAFHASLPAAARTYALPERWNRRWDLRRYGFHGLSHAWIARRIPTLVGGEGRRLRIVSCHLGAGASVCAIDSGRSVDTTMGFTPLEGLVMATRSGSLDPGLLLWLLARQERSAAEVAHVLEFESGLAGLAGTADMRTVLQRADRGQASAQLALDVYIHRLRGQIAAMAAAMDGLDVLAFTGGVGERSPQVRRLAVKGLGFLGLALEDRCNDAARPDAEIGRGEQPRIWVVSAREDWEIAAQVQAVLSPA